MPEPGVTQSNDSTLPSRGEFAALLLPLSNATLHVKLGKYLLKREIAVGGMGTVFEAIQEQPRRSVAIKLMRGGLQSPAALRRFEFESQLLARMRHPGIASVFDAGTHRLGDVDVPYYVMEYIPGAQSITEYADSHKLSIRERLELFAEICDAVHYAHQRGIIHRDIKPGNILIDGEGRPKVIDFGVARALDSDLAPATLQTEPGRVVGTLQYMSPEQIAADPHDLDARTDVYALGVVLYELLCGRLPYDVNPANLSDAARVIREEPPTKPRTVRPELSDDIETVVLNAMHKERGRRYQSAELLANDIRHVLRGEPIDAQRDHTITVLIRRVRKQIGAHRVLATVGALLTALVVAEFFGLFLDRFTPVNRWFETYLTTRLQPGSVPFADQLPHVRLVIMREATDYSALAAEAGLTSFDPHNPKSMRAMHGELMKRLTESGAKVVAFDLMFAQDDSAIDYDNAFVQGVDALNGAGIPVITGVQLWKVDDAGFPRGASRTIAGATRWGTTTAGLTPDAPWHVLAVVRAGLSQALPSFALAAVAAFAQPDSVPSYQLDAGLDRVNIVYARREASLTRSLNPLPLGSHDVVELTTVQTHPEDIPAHGITKGDYSGAYIIHMPAQKVLEASSFDYEQVWRAKPLDLHRWFQDKLILIGDERRDGPNPYPDGRAFNGFHAQAVAIENMLANAAIRRPRFVSFAGVYVFGQYVLDAIGAALGGTIALATLGSSAIWRRLSLVLGTILLLTVSVVAYRGFSNLVFPVTAIFAMVLAAMMVVKTETLRLNQLT